MIQIDGIPTNSKSNTSCADSNLEPRARLAARSKGLPRLRPRGEARKSEICRVGEDELGDRRTAVGGEIFAPPTAVRGSALWSLK
ncbi:hypothetical protein AVEN_272213-1 [Araneus ventricosus]|uniref:Uncharacterized protein n=1 Tax=Araneus ventricosus TaxID=182803 RepID=A0A4Y2SG17_ARAVE|nr:hypothetical protein AVEN_272213-1 [Araneus ventricosus]